MARVCSGGADKWTVWIFLWTLLKLILLLNCVAVNRSEYHDGVCDSMDIRNHVSNLKMLQNCTIIKGYLRIILMDRTEEEDYAQFSFPLREVTDYMLFYRVTNLKSLGGLFPNLTVIRGQDLFLNLALAIFQMPDLEDISLPSLRSIPRGTVLIRENAVLCYVKTVDWDLIIDEGWGRADINVNGRDCPSVCPEKCKITNKYREPWSACWNANTCQSRCSSECEARNTSCMEPHQCCHQECVGGCYEVNSPSKCIACRHVEYNGTCRSHCPPGTYEYLRKCVTREECIKMPKSRKPFEGRCLEDCPHGYHPDANDNHSCLFCEGECVKSCPGGVIRSVGQAKAFQGCSYVNGSLEIEILGGRQIAREFENMFGSIKEIADYLKIIHSRALRDLYFLKNLVAIHGNKLDKENKYSLIISDNDNLEKLLDWDQRTRAGIGRLHIHRGKVYIHKNPKLCLEEIHDLPKHADIDNWEEDDVHISPNTNGNMGLCKHNDFNVTVVNIDPETVEIHWNNPIKFTRGKTLLGYAIYIREAPTKDISKPDADDSCKADSWRVLDAQGRNEKSESYRISDLKSFTQYGLYVHTYASDSGTNRAQSNITYFKTLPGTPSPPTKLTAKPTSPSEITITWSPPKDPNGIITHYTVTRKWQPDLVQFVGTTDYCDKPIRFLIPRVVEEVTSSVNGTQNQNTTNLDVSAEKVTRVNGTDLQNNFKCCACKKMEPEIEVLDRSFEDQMEKFLQTSCVYKSNQNAKPDTPEDHRIWHTNDLEPQPEYETAETYMKTVLATSENYSILKADENDTDSYPNSCEQILGSSHQFVVNGTELLINNLHHFQQYIVKVIACREEETDKYICSSYALTSVRTLPLGEADDIDSSSFKIHADNMTHDSIFLKWEEPKDPNGLILSYQIECTRMNADSYKPVVPVCVSRDKYLLNKGYWYSLPDMIPGNYSFRVRAVSLSGYGNWTHPIYYGIPDTDGGFPLAGVLVGIILLVLGSGAVVLILYHRHRMKEAKFPVYWTSNPDYMSSSDYNLENWEVSPENIEFVRELGHGAFGKVYEGKWHVPNGETLKCAIKTVNESATGSMRTEFLKEASVMTLFDCHHVVKLLGVVTKNPVPYVLMELMELGDLKSFLIASRPDENKDVVPPSPRLLCEMAIDIADGMAYLAQNKFVHRDLAARNCMVAGDFTVKIGDFGMTRDTYMSDYYRRGDFCRQPVRWMSPESLRDGVFTSQSDVWSYGVVLWEIATLAAQPYQGFTNEQVCKYVIGGGIMEKPENCSELFYDMMKSCWKQNPKARPTFIELVETLLPDASPRFREVSFYFTRLSAMQEEQEQVDHDTPLTPLRSLSSETAHAGSLSDLGSETDQQYFPSTAIFEERLALCTLDSFGGCEEDSENGRTCEGACKGGGSDLDVSRELSIHSNEGSKGMSLPSSRGSRASLSGDSLQNSRLNFKDRRMSAC